MKGQVVSVDGNVKLYDEGGYVTLAEQVEGCDEIGIPLDEGQLKAIFRIVRNWGYMEDTSKSMVQTALFAGGEDLPLTASKTAVCAVCGEECEPYTTIDGCSWCEPCYAETDYRMDYN